MCNFGLLEEDAKAFLSLFMKKAAENVGGANFLLSLIEAMRKVKPNPLIAKNCKIESDQLTIVWNKVVFEEKLKTLQKRLYTSQNKRTNTINLLKEVGHKEHKEVSNMIKALAPLDFIVRPKEATHGGGFEFKMFENIDFSKNEACLNPIFIALFFCSSDLTKEALKYEFK